MEDIVVTFRSVLPVILALSGALSILVALIGSSMARRIWIALVGLFLIILGVVLYRIPAPAYPEEVIQIYSPEPGAEVTSPVSITGFGGPAFEGTLQVDVYGQEGELVGRGHATIQAGEMGERGPVTGEVEFSVETAQRGQISVMMASPRGAGMGDIQHLSSVNVTLSP